MPYGFVSGEGLLREVRNLDAPNLAMKLCIPKLNDAGLALREALRRTHDASFDALLELRPDITEIGKRLTASILLQLEFHSQFAGRYPQPKDDWITRLFGELTADTQSLEQFAENKIIFVTYNYDRLLEHRLVGALSVHYGRSDEDCIRALRNIPILHLHGDLGALPGFDAKDTVPYGPSIENQGEFTVHLEKAARRISVVHEAKDETEVFDRARKALQSVEQIVMLGFGYGARNLARLDIKRWSNAKAVWGTAFGFTPSQINYQVMQPFHNFGIMVQVAPPSFGTREFFDNNLQIFRLR